QLDKARQAFSTVTQDDEAGDFARRLALINTVAPDAHGNRIVGTCQLPQDTRLRDSVIINSTIDSLGDVRGAVIVDSDLGHLDAAPGAVAVACHAANLSLGAESFAFRSIALDKPLALNARTVHTSIPKDPTHVDTGLEDYRFSLDADPGAKPTYDTPQSDNPASFATLFARMRQRDVSPDAIEASLDARYPRKLPLPDR
ncbi:MAG: hypothetical protein KAI47_05310, partial [Deltaproteobacteria bacterium]|nr:hypothetical protein [Deltaproteobacteria bacterium]